MSLRIEYPNKSRFILLFVLLVYLLDFISGNKLGSIFMLNTNDIQIYDEMWKIFTYPLKFTSSATLFLFTVVFVFLSPNLENFYRFTFVPFFYLLIVASHGILISLLNFDNNVILSGTDGLTFFVLVLHFLLFKKTKINLYFTKINYNIITFLSLITFWVFLQGLTYFYYGSSEIYNSFILAGLGTINAFVVYMQVFIYKKINAKKNIEEKEENNELPKKQTPEMIGASRVKYYENNKKEEIPLISNDPIENEAKMNNILDKINDIGFASLSEKEQKFLEEYSKKIK